MNKQKIAVVTGGASGIGAAVVKQFVKQKIKTFVLDINPDYEGDGPLLTSYKCDVSDVSKVLKTFVMISKQHPHIDYLILNAGIYHYGNIMDTRTDHMEKVLNTNTNLKGTLYCLQAGLQFMEKKGGSIVIVGSDQSLVGKKNNSIYGVTKGALGQLTKSTALDFAEKNIRVNCVCPGAIDTPLYKQAVKSAADKSHNGDIEAVEQLVRERHPLKRIGKPEDVANLIEFLCSDKAGFITGALIPVDGGYTAQ